MSDPEAWSVTFEDTIAWISFDDGRANAYTTEGLTRFNQLLDTVEDSARAVVLEGRPGFFSAGFDLKTIKVGGSDLDDLLALGARTFARLLTYPRPIVAGCTGHALAAGALTLLASDIRVGARGDFEIGLNETAIGSPLPRFLIELARYRMPVSAVDALLWGSTHSPEDACEHGYLDVVVAPEEVRTRCRAEAERLSRLRRGVVASAKNSLRAEVADAMLADLSADLRLLNPRHAKGDKGRDLVSTRTRRAPEGEA